jgi:hypothetical protein
MSDIDSMPDGLDEPVEVGAHRGVTRSGMNGNAGALVATPRYTRCGSTI